MSKRLLFLATLSVLVLAPLRANAQKPAMRKVEFHGQLNDRGYLRIWNMAGSIRVTTWDKDSISVRGVVPVGVDFLCGGSGRAAKCGVDIPGKDDPSSPGARLEFMVPRHLDLFLKSSTASITVNGFDGNVDAYSVSGAIHLDGNAHAVTLESMAGDIDASASAETLRAKTASGAIMVTGNAEDIEASSVSGDVTVLGVKVERGRFESIDGEVRWQGALTEHASLEFSSHSGRVMMVLPRTTGGDFTISSFQGSVRNDFGPAKLVDARQLNGKELHFVLRGDDRTRVVIRNFKGVTALRAQ